MAFFQYLGVFVGTYLLVGLVLFFIVPYAGAIGFVAAILAVIYYRGKRRIRAAEDAFIDTFVETVTQTYGSENNKLESDSRRTPNDPTMTGDQSDEKR